MIALLSIGLSLATSGAVAALAMGRDRVAVPPTESEDPCRPGACTIVTKSIDADAPSIVFNVPASASTGRPAARPAPVMVAAVSTAR